MVYKISDRNWVEFAYMSVSFGKGMWTFACLMLVSVHVCSTDAMFYNIILCCFIYHIVDDCISAKKLEEAIFSAQRGFSDVLQRRTGEFAYTVYALTFIFLTCYHCCNLIG